MPSYLDHNATTPLAEPVLQAMLPYLQARFGNPSSGHVLGREARAALETAREQVAGLVNAHPSQVLFTSGGTEANNLALRGIAARLEHGRIAISAIEHASVLEPAQALGARGWQIDQIAVQADGCVSPGAVQAALHEQTRLVSVMTANNETGAIQDIGAISEVVRAHGALLHTDAVQAAGKLAVDFAACGAQLMSLSAHKIYGPKGVGALVVDRALDIEPLLLGGGQERGLRAGTENLAGIVGFGAAAERARTALAANRARLLELRGHLEQRLAAIPDAVIFAQHAPRLPNTVYFALPGIDGETLLLLLDGAGFCISSGSACESASADPSHVLLAMGVERDLARAAIRVSLGLDNGLADIDAFIAALSGQLAMLRTMSSHAFA